MMTIYH